MKNFTKCLTALLVALACVVPAQANTVILASGQSQAVSSTVACNSGCTLTLFSASPNIPAGVQLQVEIVANSIAVPIPGAVLSSQSPVFFNWWPGTLEVVRNDVTAWGVNVGVTSDVASASGGGGTTATQGAGGGASNAWAFNLWGLSGDYQADVTSGNALKVDASATTQPVSGTFYQATQPVSGTFWQATQPVSGTVTATVSGVSTAANQTSVIGTVAAGTAATNSMLQGGVYNTALPTLSSGQQAAEQLDSSGRQIVNIGTSSTIPVSGTFWQSTQPVSIATMPSTPVTGTFWPSTQPVSGTFWQTTQPVSIATAPTTPVTGTFWQATQPISATSLPLPTGAASAANQTNVIGTVAAGTAAVDSLLTGCVYNTSLPTLTTGQQAACQDDSSGRRYVTGVGGTFPATESGTWNVGLSAGTNIAGKVGIDQTTVGTTNGVVPVPATAGGTSIYSTNVTTTVLAVKTSAGQVYGWYLGNNNSSVCYLQVFNTATGSVTLGTTAPIISLMVPATGGANLSFPIGLPFSAAISVAATTTRAGNTACTNGIDANVWYF